MEADDVQRRAEENDEADYLTRAEEEDQMVADEWWGDMAFSRTPAIEERGSTIPQISEE